MNAENMNKLVDSYRAETAMYGSMFENATAEEQGLGALVVLLSVSTPKQREHVEAWFEAHPDAAEIPVADLFGSPWDEAGAHDRAEAVFALLLAVSSTRRSQVFALARRVSS